MNFSLRLLLGTALLLMPAVLRAQNRYEIDLAAAPGAAPLSPVTIGQVFDARPDRTSVGWVQRGLDNRRVPADIKGGLTGALRQLLAVPAAPEAGTYALRVLRLDVDELTRATSETASDELAVDLLRLRPDGQYELLWRGAEATDSHGMDVTSQHADNLRQLLRSCLTRFAATNPAALPAVATLTPEQAALPVTPLAPLQPFTIQREAGKPGVFATFDDFRNNTPDSKRLTAISKTPRTKADWAGTDEVDVFYVDDKGARTAVRNVWGYSDGQDLYILHQRRYYLLKPNQHGGYSFEAPSAADANAVTTGALVGGMIGAAVASASSGGYRQEHRLSLLTGRVAPVPLGQRGNDFADDGQEGQVVVYRRKPSANVVDVYAGTRMAGGLSADNGSVTVYWTDRRNPIKLCGRTTAGAETCVEVLPRPGETLYYEYVEGSGAPVLKAVSAKEGAFEAHRAELRARQNSKQ